MFSLRSAINAFPEIFEPLFVALDSCSAEDVLGIVQFEEGFEEDPAKLRVAEYFRACIQGLEEDGKLWIGVFIELHGWVKEVVPLTSELACKCTCLWGHLFVCCCCCLMI